MVTGHATHDSSFSFSDPITLALTLKALADQRRDEYPCGCGQDFRDWLVQRLGLPISGMTFDRYLRLLNTPEAVQRAVATGQLPRTLAFRVALLPPAAQNEIADRLQRGEPAKTVAQEVLQRNTRRRLPLPGTPAAEYRKLLTTARRAMRIVAGREGEIVRRAMRATDAVRILNRLCKFARDMADAETRAFQAAVDNLRRNTGRR